MKEQFRQGDVLVVRVKSIPSNAVDVTPKDRIVLMHGEVTGHAHAVREVTKARLIDVQAERYLNVLQETTLLHEEHGAIVLRKGHYQQAFQTEEQGEEVRPVAD